MGILGVIVGLAVLSAIVLLFVFGLGWEGE